jgi:arylsulfatase A-like enzyme
MSNSLKPNVLFLVLDGLRSDKFHGSTKTSITPYLDNLVKNGAYFEQCVSSAPCTVPSVASTITSLYPFECVIQDENVFTINQKLENYISSLQKFGYTTYATYQEVIYFLGLEKIYDYTETYSVSSKLWNGLGEQIIEKLENNLKEPWFYYLHLYDLHLLSFPKEYRVKNGPKEITDEKYGINQYERLISAIDPWLKKILDKIDLQNTLVVITSDHGTEVASYIGDLEEYNDRNIESRLHNPGKFFRLAQKISNNIPQNMFFGKKKIAQLYTNRTQSKIKKKMLPKLDEIDKNLSPYQKRLMRTSVWGDAFVYDDRFRIPLLIYGYNIPTNKIIKQQVRSIDIFPTIFEIIKFDQKPLGHGKSLLPLIHNENFEELPAFLEGAANAPKFVNKNIIGIRTSYFKYFRDKYDNTIEVHLYNLKNDPLEENNIAKNNPSVVQKMEEILKKLQTADGFNYEKSEQILDIDEEKKIEEELRKLGYI